MSSASVCSYVSIIFVPCTRTNGALYSTILLSLSPKALGNSYDATKWECLSEPFSLSSTCYGNARAEKANKFRNEKKERIGTANTIYYCFRPQFADSLSLTRQPKQEGNSPLGPRTKLGDVLNFTQMVLYLKSGTSLSLAFAARRTAHHCDDIQDSFRRSCRSGSSPEPSDAINHR